MLSAYSSIAVSAPTATATFPTPTGGALTAIEGVRGAASQRKSVLPATELVDPSTIVRPITIVGGKGGVGREHGGVRARPRVVARRRVD